MLASTLFQLLFQKSRMLYFISFFFSRGPCKRCLAWSCELPRLAASLWVMSLAESANQSLCFSPAWTRCRCRGRRRRAPLGGCKGSRSGGLSGRRTSHCSGKILKCPQFNNSKGPIWAWANFGPIFFSVKENVSLDKMTCQHTCTNTISQTLCLLLFLKSGSKQFHVLDKDFFFNSSQESLETLR